MSGLKRLLSFSQFLRYFPLIKFGFLSSPEQLSQRAIVLLSALALVSASTNFKVFC